MKILYDHQIFTWQRYGGISRYFYELATRIASYPDTDVTVLALVYANRYLNNDNSFKCIGRYIPYIPTTMILRKMFNATVSKWWTKSCNPDIIHETYYSETFTGTAKSKTVITVFDMIHEKILNDLPRGDTTRRNKAHVVKRADHIICISENTRKDLIEILDVPVEKTSVVYLGPSLSTVNPPRKTASPKKTFILYVGDRNNYKNFDTFLRAYGRSSHLKNDFSVVCFGGGGFKKNELTLMEKLHIPVKKVTQIAGDDKVLANLYASAAVFVYPSLYEGFGIPPLEAMSFGCPVVSTDSSSLPEVVGNAAELFNPADEMDMANAIERVVYSQDRAQILINRGYERIKQFSWEKTAQNTLELYKKIMIL